MARLGKRVSNGLDTTPIDKFAARVRAANAGRAKDIRMPLEEAVDLAAALTAVLARLAALEAEKTESGDLVLDGGTVT